MAHYFSCIFLTFILLAESAFASKVVDINLICKEVQNPSFCTTILISNPNGGKGADLVSHANYTIEVARCNITNTISLIKSLIANSGNDGEAKSHYEECLVLFGGESGSLGDIMDAQKCLKVRDYYGVTSAASSIIASIEYCISGEDPEDPPYLDKSNLPKYGRFIEQVVEIVLEISKYLKKE